MDRSDRSDRDTRSLVSRRDLQRSLRADRESGQAMVEFALILIPLLILVVGIIQFGIGLNYWLDMNRLSNQGARWAVVNEYPGCTRNSPTQGVSARTVSLQRYVACQGSRRTQANGRHLVPLHDQQRGRSRQGDCLIAVFVPRDHEAGDDHPGGEDHHAARADSRRATPGSGSLRRRVHETIVVHVTPLASAARSSCSSRSCSR